jgi:uncharacterized protein (DUF3820 family)
MKMQSKKDSSGYVRIVLCSLVVALLGGTASLGATEPDALAKQIERNLSRIQRGIATGPSRAEKDMLATRKLLAQLKEAAPNHAKLAPLEKKAADLTKKLEKRLGRPVGGSAPKEETKPAAAPKPAAPSNLPSSVVRSLKQMDTALNAVVTALEKNRLQTAGTKLKQAQKLMAEIQKRYGKKIPAGDATMKAATERLAAIGAKFIQAESAAAASAAAAAEIEQLKEAQSREWIDKFSPFFDSDTGQRLLIGAAFHRASEAEKEKCLQAFAKANELMAAYQKAEFPHGKTGELVTLQQSLAGTLKIHNEGAARARQEEACQPWVDKLRPYADVGAGSQKYLVTGVTLSESDIQNRAALLKEAQTLWSEYEKAEFPLGKTARLLDLEETMQKRFKEMPEDLRRSRTLVSGDIEKEFDRILSYLAQDTGWKNDKTKKPNIVMERDVTPLQKAIDRYAGTVDAGDAKLATLKQKLAQVKQQDRNNRAMRAERTFMNPDRFKGDGIDELRQKAEEIVKEKSSDGKALRITLPAEAWKEESVIEWTDTSHTQLRHRVTRSMTAQAAAKAADGKVYLHGVHLANNRQSDGSWGPLHGHIMWSDWMAEPNVNKEPPAP